MSCNNINLVNVFVVVVEEVVRRKVSDTQSNLAGDCLNCIGKLAEKIHEVRQLVSHVRSAACSETFIRGRRSPEREGAAAAGTFL